MTKRDGWGEVGSLDDPMSRGLAPMALWSPVVGLMVVLLAVGVETMGIFPIGEVGGFLVGFIYLGGQLAGVVLGVMTIRSSPPGSSDRTAGKFAVVLGSILLAGGLLLLVPGLAMGARVP